MSETRSIQHKLAAIRVLYDTLKPYPRHDRERLLWFVNGVLWDEEPITEPAPPQETGTMPSTEKKA